MAPKKRKSRNVMGLDTLEEQARALNMATTAYNSAVEALNTGEIIPFVYWSGYLASSRDLAMDEGAYGLADNVKTMIQDLRDRSGMDLG